MSLSQMVTVTNGTGFEDQGEPLSRYGGYLFTKKLGLYVDEISIDYKCVYDETKKQSCQKVACFDSVLRAL